MVGAPGAGRRQLTGDPKRRVQRTGRIGGKAERREPKVMAGGDGPSGEQGGPLQKGEQEEQEWALIAGSREVSGEVSGCRR